MPVTFEPISGYLARIGPDHHRYGDPYTAVCIVEDDGTVKGLAGSLSPRLISEARKTAERELGLTLNWKRIRDMAYSVEMKAIDSHGRANPTVTFVAETYEDWCELQDIIEAGFKAARDARRKDRPGK